MGSVPIQLARIVQGNVLINSPRPDVALCKYLPRCSSSSPSPNVLAADPRAQVDSQDILTAAGTPERVNILGVGVSAITVAQALDVIDRWIEQRAPHYICVSGVHGLAESLRDPSLRAIHNEAGLVTPDGMPLVWLSRLRGARHVERVYGPDLMLACCERSVETGYRHFFYGGAAGIPELLARRLCQRFPGLQIVGSYSPPFHTLSEAEDDAIAERIAATAPDIVWVGLSTPKQERWMHGHVGRVGAPVVIGVGAAFDFHAGVKKQAPRWMQRSGLEWLFRLMSEPRRLWRRYTTSIPRFVWHTMVQLVNPRRYEM
jgi:N-acetylglucosaminyldiphosphoundecaprenol N-acetyl-beta-D-mannosaminyltransferase